MRCHLVAFALAAAVSVQTVSAQATAPDAVRNTLQSAAQALGITSLDNIQGIEYWGSGMMYSFSQAFTPGGAWPPAKVTDYHAVVSYGSSRAMKLDYVRNNPDGPIRGGGQLPLAAPQRNIQALSLESNATYAWNEQAGGNATPAMAAIPGRSVQFWTLNPFAVLRAAADAGAEAKVAREKGATVVRFPVSNGAGQKLNYTAIIGANNLLQKVEVKSPDPVLGDIVTETAYSDYKDLAENKRGVMFPAHITQKQAGFPTWDLMISKVDADSQAKIETPDNVKGAAQQGAGVKVDPQKVADGVWYLTGGSHHSVLVEFNDHLALVECPQDEERASAVLESVKRTVPNKPLRYVVNSHHHFDHLGGLRTCAAEGVTIITQSANKPYFERIWKQPHTIAPDRLAKERKNVKIEGLRDKRVLTDGNRTLELYKLPQSYHAETMLIGYLPKEKILIDADVYTPGPPNAPPPAQPNRESLNLYTQVQALKLDVQQITPLHGRLVTIEDLRKAIGQATSSQAGTQ